MDRGNSKVRVFTGNVGVLGLGTSSSVAYLLTVSPTHVVPPTVMAVLEYPRKKYAEVEHKHEHDESAKKVIEDEMAAMWSSLTHLTGMVHVIYNGSEIVSLDVHDASNASPHSHYTPEETKT